MSEGAPPQADTSMDILEFIASMTGSLAWPLAAFLIALLFSSQIRILLARLNEVAFGGAKATFAKQLDAAERTAESLPPPTEPIVACEEPSEVDRGDEDDQAPPVRQNVDEGPRRKRQEQQEQKEEQEQEQQQQPRQEPEKAASSGTKSVPGGRVLWISTGRDGEGNPIRIKYEPRMRSPWSDEPDNFAVLLGISPGAAILDTFRIVERELRRVLIGTTPVRAPLRLVPRQIARALVRDGHLSSEVGTLVAQLQDMRNQASHGSTEVSVVDAIRFRDIASRVMVALAALPKEGDDTTD